MTKFTKEQQELLERLITFREGSDDVFGIEGDVKGNVNGDVCGNVEGDVCGNVKGDVCGNVEGDVGGHIYGNVWGCVWGNVWGNVFGRVGGDVWGEVKGNVGPRQKMYDNLKERLTDMSVLASTRTPADALQYIEELEAKLAKVIILAGAMAEAIEDQIDTCDASMDEQIAVKNYRATLAELTGGKDE